MLVSKSAKKYRSCYEDVDSVLRSLGCEETKRRLYSVDTYFRESCLDALNTLHGSLEKLLYQHCSLIVKPEAVCGRKIDAILEFLAANSFQLVSAQEFQLCRLSAREIWRYQINTYPIERIDFIDYWIHSGPWVFLLLVDLKAEYGSLSKSACERITALKGVSAPEKSSPSHIRHSLGQSIDILNFVHTPDDSGDFIRDLGVIFNQSDRNKIYLDLCHNKIPAPSEMEELRSIEEHANKTDLSIIRARNQLKNFMTHGTWSQRIWHALESLLENKGNPEYLRILKPVLDEAQHSMEFWDIVVIKAYCTPPVEQGEIAIIHPRSEHGE